jgi:hypothetical protein
MKQNSRLRTDEAQTQSGEHAQHQETAKSPLQFSSPEAMLRHDAAQTPAPPQVADRLRASLADEPARPTSWWRRLFGR